MRLWFTPEQLDTLAQPAGRVEQAVTVIGIAAAVLWTVWGGG